MKPELNLKGKQLVGMNAYNIIKPMASMEIMNKTNPCDFVFIDNLSSPTERLNEIILSEMIKKKEVQINKKGGITIKNDSVEMKELNKILKPTVIPEHIVIGEIRSREEIDSVMKAMECNSGHNVVTTMMCANPSEAVNRLIEMCKLSNSSSEDSSKMAGALTSKVNIRKLK